MFLKEFAIGRYGPLPGSGKIKLSRFNLFYGPNEDGKTLTIDALLKMLLGKGAGSSFSAVKRVDEEPEGYLVIENEDGRELKLPEAGLLQELYTFSASEFANIFVIRDSDLKISEEGDFYRSVTARLTGMRSKEIKSIKEQLLELGRVTPGGDFLNKAPVKLKDRVNKASTLLKKAEKLLVRLREDNFSTIEKELARLNRERRGASEKIQLYLAASSRERYEKGLKALENYKKAAQEAEKLNQYRQEDYQAWQNLASNLKHLFDDRRRREDELSKVEKELASARGQLKQKDAGFGSAERRYAEVYDLIGPLLEHYDRQQVSLRLRETLISNPFYSRATYASLAIFLISLAGSAYRPAWWLYIILLCSLFSTALLVWFKLNCLFKQGQLKAAEARIVIAAEKSGLSACDLREARFAIGRLKTDLATENASLQEAKHRVEWLQKEQGRLSGELEENMGRIRAARENIAAISYSSGVASLEDFGAALERKKMLETEIERQKSLLQSHFGPGEERFSAADALSYWSEQVDELSGYATAAPGVSFNQKELDKLNAELESADEENSRLKAVLGKYGEELRDIEKELNVQIFIDREEYLPCQTAVDLEAIGEKLRQWIGEQEENRAAAICAYEIFNQLELEEEQKITALFSPDSPVNRYFGKITSGRYRKASFKGGDSPITVIRSDGASLSVSDLSGGTHDQLYFAIRLALAEKLTGREKGFFILDDPFIKADPIRLKMLIELLFEICSSGWQILFFSSKGEIKDALCDQLNQKKVELFSIS